MTAIDKIDRVFSRYIRELHAIDGYCICFTCDTKIPFGLTDCGHFRGLRHMATRWHEHNTAPHCTNCNRVKGGMYEVFKERLIKKYGLQTVEDLVRLSHTTVRLTKPELETIYQNHKEKLDTMMKLKSNLSLP